LGKSSSTENDSHALLTIELQVAISSIQRGATHLVSASSLTRESPLTKSSIGQQFALTEASFAVIRILQTFKAIERREDSDFKELLTLTAAVRNGVQVGLTPA